PRADVHPERLFTRHLCRLCAGGRGLAAAAGGSLGGPGMRRQCRSGEGADEPGGPAVTDSSQDVGARLNEKLAQAGLGPLDPALAGRFGEYCSLLLRWNARTNLTAIRDEDGILSRHFVESIACARALPTGLHTLLDFGSGAGFP